MTALLAAGPNIAMIAAAALVTLALIRGLG